MELTNEDIDKIIIHIIERFEQLKFLPICNKCGKKVDITKEELYYICPACINDIGFDKIERIVNKK